MPNTALHTGAECGLGEGSTGASDASWRHQKPFKKSLEATQNPTHLHIPSNARKQDSLLHFSEQISDFLIRERAEY